MSDNDLPMIPFNRPSLAGKEQEYFQAVIENRHASGDGPFTRKCHQMLQEYLGAPKALLTTSCTHALEMTALLLDLQPGDEVIMPSFTFVSTVNAYALRGARPVFADIRPDTLNIDERLIEDLITPQTRAIVVVHYAGVGCEMDVILDIAQRHNLTVIEDNAHGLFGQYKGQKLGTFGAMATQSFHETKNISCGEGGALIINDPQYIERAEIIREKGTNRSQFFRGQVDKYTWVDIGSSYLPSDILAAFLYAQLEASETIQQNRQRSWERYNTELESWASAYNIRLPIVPDYCQQPYHMFYLLLPTLEMRQALIAHLKAQQVLSVFHYQPLHLSVMGKQYGGREGDCPVTERISDQLLRLPLFNNFTDAEQDRVMAAIQSFNPEK
ncbi:MAG: dTDP-4-amino-4,6-dideoxygalactose transaminase [Anaerolineaceae bacterium]|nr:dTDP-4-amino-4,6-dideoxygalactose transaminase [Anaerolineaceae bacterium]